MIQPVLVTFCLLILALGLFGSLASVVKGKPSWLPLAVWALTQGVSLGLYLAFLR